MQMTGLAEQWNAQIADSKRLLPGEPGWLDALRKTGAEAFRRNGLPHRKVEDWKYTSLKLLEARSARLAEAGDVHATDIQLEWPEPVLKAESCLLHMLNGRLHGTPDIPGNISVAALGQALAADTHPWLCEMLESLEVDPPSRAFSALNTSTLGEGLVVHVPANTDGGTLVLQWAFDDASPARLFNTRVAIRLEAGARLNLVEQFESASGHNHALNLVTQVRVGRGAQLNVVRVQQAHEDSALITRTECDVAAEGRFECSSFDLGGGLVRHDCHPRLLGDGATAQINGAFVMDGTQHVDHHVFADHVSGNTHSGQFFRGVLSGRSRGVFNGKARICEGADGSTVRQSNANLLLSDHAEIDTKPELEIYADEVEASHGATVGQLDEDAVFYLRSRGLDEEQARGLLMGAFCKAVLDETTWCPAPINEAIARFIEDKLSAQV